MNAPLLKVQGVSKHFGGFTALSEVSIAIAPGERFGLIGPNGSGKTTLINCISGSLRNDGGSIEFAGEEISGLAAYQRTRKGIARSFQIPRPFHSMRARSSGIASAPPPSVFTLRREGRFCKQCVLPRGDVVKRLSSGRP